MKKLFYLIAFTFISTKEDGCPEDVIFSYLTYRPNEINYEWTGSENMYVIIKDLKGTILHKSTVSNALNSNNRFNNVKGFDFTKDYIFEIYSRCYEFNKADLKSLKRYIPSEEL